MLHRIFKFNLLKIGGPILAAFIFCEFSQEVSAKEISISGIYSYGGTTVAYGKSGTATGREGFFNLTPLPEGKLRLTVRLHLYTETGTELGKGVLSNTTRTDKFNEIIIDRTFSPDRRMSFMEFWNYLFSKEALLQLPDGWPRFSTAETIWEALHKNHPQLISNEAAPSVYDLEKRGLTRTVRDQESQFEAWVAGQDNAHLVFEDYDIVHAKKMKKLAEEKRVADEREKEKREREAQRTLSREKNPALDQLLISLGADPKAMTETVGRPWLGAPIAFHHLKMMDTTWQNDRNFIDAMIDEWGNLKPMNFQSASDFLDYFGEKGLGPLAKYEKIITQYNVPGQYALSLRPTQVDTVNDQLGFLSRTRHRARAIVYLYRLADATHRCIDSGQIVLTAEETGRLLRNLWTLSRDELKIVGNTHDEDSFVVSEEVLGFHHEHPITDWLDEIIGDLQYRGLKNARSIEEWVGLAKFKFAHKAESEDAQRDTFLKALPKAIELGDPAMTWRENIRGYVEMNKHDDGAFDFLTDVISDIPVGERTDKVLLPYFASLLLNRDYLLTRYEEMESTNPRVALVMGLISASMGPDTAAKILPPASAKMREAYTDKEAGGLRLEGDDRITRTVPAWELSTGLNKYQTTILSYLIARSKAGATAQIPIPLVQQLREEIEKFPEIGIEVVETGAKNGNSIIKFVERKSSASAEIKPATFGWTDTKLGWCQSALRLLQKGIQKFKPKFALP